MKRALRKILWALTGVFVLLNVVAMVHAYKFTHFADVASPRPDRQALTIGAKLQAVAMGVDLPRPVNSQQPATAFEDVVIESNKRIHGWHIPAVRPSGTVILFHGYGASKSMMLDKAEVFRALGYNTLLIDFMGAGDSEGNQTTIGYHEATQVKSAYEYIRSRGETNVFLFGTSMGAVSILKAMQDFSLAVNGIMIECPFGTMYETVSARFRMMRVPRVPMAALLMFWGGVENGFWAFSHNPAEYAKEVTCPALLMYGARDNRVSRQEIDTIFRNLQGEKELKVYENAGHVNYLRQYREAWTQDVGGFMRRFK